MDIKDLKILIKMVTETDITEFEMAGTDEKIIIKRGRGQEIVHIAAPAAPVFSAAAPAPPTAGTPGAAPAAAAPAKNDKYETVTSPIVGTFYRAPSPILIRMRR